MTDSRFIPSVRRGTWGRSRQYGDHISAYPLDSWRKCLPELEARFDDHHRSRIPSF